MLSSFRFILTMELFGIPARTTYNGISNFICKFFAMFTHLSIFLLESTVHVHPHIDIIYHANSTISHTIPILFCSFWLLNIKNSLWKYVCIVLHLQLGWTWIKDYLNYFSWNKTGVLLVIRSDKLYAYSLVSSSNLHLLPKLIIKKKNPLLPEANDHIKISTKLHCSRNCLLATRTEPFSSVFFIMHATCKGKGNVWV